MEENHWFFGGRTPVSRGFRFAGVAVFGILAAAVFGLVFGVFVMLLWNWLMPTIFALPEISYWQAFGIVILVKLVFGTIGHGRHGHNRNKGPWDPDGRHTRSGRRYWREYWRDEGRDAFDRYVDAREAEASTGTGPSPESRTGNGA
jgi:hypothetical protein